jgi:hypothetical protein
VAVAYAPVVPLVLLGAPVGWPVGDYRDAVPWPVVNQFVCVAGGAAWAAAALVPLVYAATRGAWALGVPLGLSEELLRRGQAEGAWAAGASLATVAVAGSLLTLGLAQRWGEVFPRWLPTLGGKPVPPALAVVPAALVAVLVTNAGLTFWRKAVLGTTAFPLSGGNWAALLPELLWPLWGVALGAAALAYYLRRRPPPALPRGAPGPGTGAAGGDAGEATPSPAGHTIGPPAGPQTEPARAGAGAPSRSGRPPVESASRALPGRHRPAGP